LICCFSCSYCAINIRAEEEFVFDDDEINLPDQVKRVVANYNDPNGESAPIIQINTTRINDSYDPDATTAGMSINWEVKFSNKLITLDSENTFLNPKARAVQTINRDRIV